LTSIYGGVDGNYLFAGAMGVNDKIKSSEMISKIPYLPLKKKPSVV